MRAVLAVLDHANAPVEKIAALRQPVDEIETKATTRVMGRAQPSPASPVTPTA